VALFNGESIGSCPVRILVYPGKHRLGWQKGNNLLKEIVQDLKEATVSKFRLHPSDNSVSDEISRDGCMTIYQADKEPAKLEEIIGDYLVNDLTKLPNPDEKTHRYELSQIETTE